MLQTGEIDLDTPLTWAIYGLFEPDWRAIRYIGRTYKPRTRLQQHIQARGQWPVSRWCTGLRDRGLRPAMYVFEWSTDWDEAERRWIAKARGMGAILLNIGDGGNAGASGHHIGRRHRTLTALSRILAGQGRRHVAQFIRDTAREARAQGGESLVADFDAYMAAGLRKPAHNQAASL